MEIDDAEDDFSGVNLTACLVLNQRDDETLGFDFISFPGNNELLGVVDLAPGAHFIYVKRDEGNDDIDLRIGMFLHINANQCTVLKRNKTEDGPLFEEADPDESSSYHSGLVAGHFVNKTAKIPEQLKQLWNYLTAYISDDVIRTLRPISKKVSSKSRFQVEHGSRARQTGNTLRTADIATVGDTSIEEDQSRHDKDSYANAKLPDVDVETNTDHSKHVCSKDIGSGENTIPASDDLISHSLDSNRSRCKRGFIPMGAEEDETADNYKLIAQQFKQMKGHRGTLTEVMGTSQRDSATSMSRSAPVSHVSEEREMDLTKHENDPSAQDQPYTSETKQHIVVDAELNTEPCTIYYSDLRRINKGMSLLTDVAPASITQMHLDTTHILDAISDNHRRYKEQSPGRPARSACSGEASPSAEDTNKYHPAIGEYQYAFCMFLLNYHYDSFEHWKAIFRAICGAETFFLNNTALGEQVLHLIRYQLETFESDLYEPDNFFAYHLSSLEEIIIDNQPELADLLRPLQEIKDTFKLKFGISFEDAKVLQDNVKVVDIHEMGYSNGK